MKKLYYFLIIFLFIRNNSQIKENPFYLFENTNPFILSLNDDNYYYVISSNNIMKIIPESGDIEINNDINLNILDYIHFGDYKNNNYLFKSISQNSIFPLDRLNFEYYQIKYNSFIYYEKITNHVGEKRCFIKMKPVGGILQGNEFVIYGYSDNNECLIFINDHRSACVSLEMDNINEKLSCKFIEGKNFICAVIINNKLDVYCLNYYNSDTLILYTNLNSLTYNSISSFGFYDTDNKYIKLLCRQSNQGINCIFFEVQIIDTKSSFVEMGSNNLLFETSNELIEKNCYFSLFNSENFFVVL